MELNKLEQDFKTKLEQRTIQPTEMAWDRLDAMLAVAEKKKPKRKYWMYVAATFLGFLLIGALLLNLEKETTGKTGITTGDAVVGTGQPGDNKKENYRKEAEENIMSAPDITITAKNETVARQEDVKPGIKASSDQVIVKRKTIKEAKESAVYRHEEAVAIQQVENTQAQEAEKLLDDSLNSERAKKKSSVKVDANSLLSSVEAEIDNNFRSEVLQKVVKNYNTVKSSVANRNYQ